jgi:AraC-like DNA-binding protein
VGCVLNDYDTGAIKCAMQFSTHKTPIPAAPTTHSALTAPRLSLASCVRAFITRSTLGVDLRPDQRHNYYPASLLCTITFAFQGESQIVRSGDAPFTASVTTPVSAQLFAAVPNKPRAWFSGPHTAPLVTFDPGPVHLLMVSLTPASLVAMTGVDIAAWVNRIVPLEMVLDPTWQAMAHAVMAAPDDAVAVRCIEDFLEPRWGTVSHSAMPKADRYRYWVESLALRASTSGVGSSLRQMERRIKQWAGLPMRDLRRLTRAEDSFFRVRDAQQSGALDWATAAADGGYSDQAHLCRETRRVTGLSPKELSKAIDTEEGFWLYRLRD